MLLGIITEACFACIGRGVHIEDMPIWGHSKSSFRPRLLEAFCRACHVWPRGVAAAAERGKNNPMMAPVSGLPSDPLLKVSLLVG